MNTQKTVMQRDFPCLGCNMVLIVVVAAIDDVVNSLYQFILTFISGSTSLFKD